MSRARAGVLVVHLLGTITNTRRLLGTDIRAEDPPSRCLWAPSVEPYKVKALRPKPERSEEKRECCFHHFLGLLYFGHSATHPLVAPLMPI